jgi:hypothetical protein
MPTPTATQRAFATNVSFGIGLMTVSLDLVPQMAPGLKEATEFKLACPHDAGEVSQRYICKADPTHRNLSGEMFTERDLERVRVIDGTRHPVSAEQIAAVRSSGDVKSATFSVHKAAEVEAVTRPGGAGYRLRPPAKANRQVAQVYATLLHLAGRADLAIVTLLELPKTGQKMYRLSAFRGQLMIHEVVRPDELAPVDEIEAEAPEAVLVMAEQLAESLVTPFEADAFRNAARERAAALDEALAVGEAAPAPAPAVAPEPESDLLATLAASLEASKPARPISPPRTPRKRKAPAKAPTATDALEA